MKEARLSKLVPSKTHFLKSSDSIKNAAIYNERERETKPTCLLHEYLHTQFCCTAAAAAAAALCIL
jgi:hypothetical protein